MDLLEQMCAEYADVWNEYAQTDVGDYVNLIKLRRRLAVMEIRICVIAMKSFGYEFDGFFEKKNK